MNHELPISRRSSVCPELIEREIELDGLLALARTNDGTDGTIVLVSGEAGIGKSSLIAAFAQAIAKERTVRIGRSDPLLTSRPFAPMYDLSGQIAHLLHSMEGKGKSRDQIFNAVAVQLVDLDKSAVLIFEDLHWIDPSTAEMLQFIGRRIAEFGFLVVLTYRSDEIGKDHPLTAVLGDLPQRRVKRIELQPLTVDAISELAKCPMRKAQGIHELTGGIPFYVREYLDAGEHLPSSVSEMLSAKLTRLPEEMRTVLEILSVSPEPVNPAVLKRMEGDEAIDYALKCVEAGLAKELADGRLSLRHELARLAIYDALPALRRRQIHRAYCGAIAGSNNIGTLAIQLHHADAARDAEQVLVLSYRAALSAAKLSAHSEAFAFTTVGLKYIDAAGDRAKAELKELWAGSACVSTCMDKTVTTARKEAAELWIELGKNVRAAGNLRWLSRLHWYRCEPAEARQSGLESIDLLRATGSLRDQALAEALSAQLLFLDLEIAEAISAAESAIDLAEKAEATEARIHALNTLGSARCFSGDSDGIEDLRQSIDLAELATYGDFASRDADIARGFLNLADHAANYRLFDLADDVMTEGSRRCAEIDFELWVTQLAGRRAEVFLEQGRIDEAAQLAEQSLQNEAMTPQAAQRIELVLAKAAMRTGDEMARRQLDDCLASASKSDDLGMEISVRLAQIEWAFLNSDAHYANIHLACLNQIPASKFHNWNWATFVAWRIHFGAEESSGCDHQMPKAFESEIAGETRDAFQGFLDLGCPVEAALCLLRNRESSSDDQTQTAHELCKSMGASAVANLFERRNLGKLGARKRGPYKAARQHPLGITSKELQVLKLLAEGATNREIADQFNRSVRTIDRHVSALLRKLDVSSRIDIVIRLRNEPWILGTV